MTRDDFIDLVYEELSEDSDNCRANRIIDAADEYAYPKDEGLEPCPFCGDVPKTYIALPHFERLMADCIAIKVVCPVCHVARSVCIREGTDFGTVKEEMDRLIEDWNTRMKKE